MKDATDFILAFGMLTTGSINSIVTKLADSNCQRDADNRPLLYDPAATTAPPFWGPAGTTPGVELVYQEDHPLHGYQCVQFNHPFVQAAFMFIGEILCGVLYIGLRCTGRGEPMPYFNPLYLAVAGLCDMTATSMMYVGLTMTYVSTFQVSVRPSVCILRHLHRVSAVVTSLRWPRLNLLLCPDPARLRRRGHRGLLGVCTETQAAEVSLGGRGHGCGRYCCGRVGSLRRAAAWHG